MEFHEKSLELNITHEILNLADSWYWFLTDIPLWRYWRPRYRQPFLKFPKSTSGGFHITTEGKDDPTGNAGGGFDVRIKTGIDNHLLFIQYKKGDLVTTSPAIGSEFANPPHDHFKFKINSTSTNQHFVLRNLAAGIGGANQNAVVYAMPLIADMNELEANAGKLIRKTKFISIADIDAQALLKGNPFVKDQEHNFRVGKFDMNRCEVNFYFFNFYGTDRTSEIIADIIALKFQRSLDYFLKTIEANYKEYDLFEDYFPSGLQQSFIQYVRYLLHYFEVSPLKLEVPFLAQYTNYFFQGEFNDYDNLPRDVQILTAVFNALTPYAEYFGSMAGSREIFARLEIPIYQSKFLIPMNERGLVIRIEDQVSSPLLEDVTYLVI
jgi:hypothetical protein